jgi:hypothetical protein
LVIVGSVEADDGRAAARPPASRAVVAAAATRRRRVMAETFDADLPNSFRQPEPG